MSKYVLTVITRGNNYIHSVHESEDQAKAEQHALLQKLNNTLKAAQEPFVQIGNHIVRLGDVERSTVTTEDDAPGSTMGFA